ncbi:hypothetical protein DEJ46_31445 [Streptomyces venezuelae]|uniref:Uncharacterized protein n=1 Tax=Streptomyces venezuelae TaxID=54571 RepID=A0A5P2AY54_STRVZ|nr:hypothetical protein DEJ46_31445 [Streptomyces venezuelae]
MVAQGDRQAEYAVRSARAEPAVREGRPEEARGCSRGTGRRGTAHLTAWAPPACGRAEEAAEVAGAEVARAARAGERLAKTEARTARAAALAALGREREAAEGFDRAAALAEELPYLAGARQVAGARASGEGGRRE